MASTSTAESSSAMEETPNWLKMPHDLMRMILQRLGAVEVLNNAQKVCTTWRRISKDPAMWKLINMRDSNKDWYKDYDLEMLTKQAVHRSCGELTGINIEFFGSDELLDHISRCSSKLSYLRLVDCYDITSSGLGLAVKRLPHLEHLYLFFIEINAEDIEVIGHSCPLLKSFKMNKAFKNIECDVDALAIAKNMPALRHLQLLGSTMTNNGLQAILHGCPHLESLDLRGCFNLDLGGNLKKLCMERIKDLKCPNDSIEIRWICLRIEEYKDYDDGHISHDDDVYGDDYYHD